MDLLESTLRVIENRDIAKESLTLSKQDLNQYEHNINQLQDYLQELQSSSSKNTKILEINNFTKNAFNENSKESKILFGLIYGYVQQIEKNLHVISQNENFLEALCNENEERLDRIETNFNNTLKLIEIMKNDVRDRIKRESNDLQEQIAAKSAELHKCEEAWISMGEENEEKERTLNALNLEIEILQDNIDLEIQEQETLAQEKKEENEKILLEIGRNFDLNNKILEIEENLLINLEKQKDIWRNKTDIILKRNELEKKMTQLENECCSFEKQICESEKETKQETDRLKNETELTRKLIEKNENTLSACRLRTNDLTSEMEGINAKLVALDEEIQDLHRTFANEEKDFLENNNSEKLAEEHDDLISSCLELQRKISEIKIKIDEKQIELEVLKNTPDQELIEMREKLEALDSEAAKKAEQEKEMEEIDCGNKRMTQSIENDKINIKELNARKIKLEHERDESHTQFKNLILQCDNVEKDIQRLEVLNEEGRKLFSRPPQKRIRTSSQRQEAKKRTLIREYDSESSADGERLSYSEFMAKKRARENKKQKK